MTVDQVVFWLFVGAWLVVLGLIGFVQLPRLLHDGRRLVRRVQALVNESPLPLQIAKAEADINRMRRAAERVPELQRRALAAVTLIRTTPLVPRAIGEVAGRIRAELRALGRAAR
jgi:hypothetical protein